MEFKYEIAELCVSVLLCKLMNDECVREPVGKIPALW